MSYDMEYVIALLDYSEKKVKAGEFYKEIKRDYNAIPSQIFLKNIKNLKRTDDQDYDIFLSLEEYRKYLKKDISLTQSYLKDLRETNIG